LRSVICSGLPKAIHVFVNHSNDKVELAEQVPYVWSNGILTWFPYTRTTACVCVAQLVPT